MPKLVDHDKIRLDIIKSAALLFSRHGYSGLGMREMAAELGMSKSALYHYFPSKRALFEACTEAVTQGQTQALSADTREQPAAEALIAFAQSMEPEFAAEMTLLFDYLRGKTPEQIAADPAMAQAMERYCDTLLHVTDAARVKPALAYLLGMLLLRHFDGHTTGFEDLSSGLQAVLATEDPTAEGAPQKRDR